MLDLLICVEGRPEDGSQQRLPIVLAIIGIALLDATNHIIAEQMTVCAANANIHSTKNGLATSQPEL